MDHPRDRGTCSSDGICFLCFHCRSWHEIELEVFILIIIIIVIIIIIIIIIITIVLVLVAFFLVNDNSIINGRLQALFEASDIVPKSESACASAGHVRQGGKGGVRRKFVVVVVVVRGAGPESVARFRRQGESADAAPSSPRGGGAADKSAVHQAAGNVESQ